MWLLPRNRPQRDWPFSDLGSPSFPQPPTPPLSVCGRSGPHPERERETDLRGYSRPHLVSSPWIQRLIIVVVQGLTFCYWNSRSYIGVTVKETNVGELGNLIHFYNDGNEFIKKNDSVRTFGPLRMSSKRWYDTITIQDKWFVLVPPTVYWWVTMKIVTIVVRVICFLFESKSPLERTPVFLSWTCGIGFQTPKTPVPGDGVVEGVSSVVVETQWLNSFFQRGNGSNKWCPVVEGSKVYNSLLSRGVVTYKNGYIKGRWIGLEHGKMVKEGLGVDRRQRLDPQDISWLLVSLPLRKVWVEKMGNETWRNPVKLETLRVWRSLRAFRVTVRYVKI